MLVPGERWGDESVWLARIANILAGRASVTLLVNGGDIAWQDAARSVAAGRRVIAVAGSGRTADELAAAVRGDPADSRASTLAESGLVDIIPWDEPHALELRLQDLLADRA